MATTWNTSANTNKENADRCLKEKMWRAAEKKPSQNDCQSKQKEGVGEATACRGEASGRTGGHGEER